MRDIVEYKLVIGEVRRSKGMKQCELAEIIGISKSYMCQIEDNNHDIKLSLLVKIANALGVHPRELYEK